MTELRDGGSRASGFPRDTEHPELFVVTRPTGRQIVTWRSLNGAECSGSIEKLSVV